MTIVFADTLYWIALINARHQWHEPAVSIKTTLADSNLVTTESVLMEVANFFAEYGEVMCRKVALVIRAILIDEQLSHAGVSVFTVRPGGISVQTGAREAGRSGHALRGVLGSNGPWWGPAATVEAPQEMSALAASNSLSTTAS